MAPPMESLPMAEPGTRAVEYGDRGGRGEENYARERAAPPALGRVEEGQSCEGCQKMTKVWITAAALLQLLAAMTG